MKREEMQCHVLLDMPDGMMMGLWIPKGEDIRDCINGFMDHWFEAIGDSPDKYGIIVLDEECPKCGKPMHVNKRFMNHRFCPHCRYQEHKGP